MNSRKMSNRGGNLSSRTGLRRRFFALPELLEGRTLMSTTWIVNSLGDTNTGNNTSGTLRYDLSHAQDGDVIHFAIPGAGAQRIALSASLPTITAQITLDGTSQPGYAGTPLVWLDGSAITNWANGNNALRFSSGGNVIQGLAITGFKNGSAIELDGPGSNTVRDNYLGLSPSGSFAGDQASNNNYGLMLLSPGNAVSDNVISENGQDGIFVYGDGNAISGNLIGTAADGTGALTASGFSAVTGNGHDGIFVQSGRNTRIGGSTAADRNVISGNYNAGVEFANLMSADSFDHSLVQGNYIGVDASGISALGNSANNVYVATELNAGVQTLDIVGNVISSSGGDGIRLCDGANNVSISGNLIGLDATGTITRDASGSALGNDGNGITILGSASGNTIGGPAVADRNVISGNRGDGVTTTEGSTQPTGSGNSVRGNYIGTDITGTHALNHTRGAGNGVTSAGDGLSITGNLISGNSGFGVELDGNGNIVQDNYIGTQADGIHALGNQYDGIMIGYNNTGSGNRIGGAGHGNVIAFNAGNGVAVSDGIENVISQNSIYGNLSIGIDLNWDGVTPNNSLGHSGPNLFQNFPDIAAATATGRSVKVEGKLTGINAADAANYTIEFFANTQADTTGFGPGEKFIGTITGIASDGSFSVTFTVPGSLPQGSYVISATATDSAGNTSEFSEVGSPIAIGAPSTESQPTALAVSPESGVYGAYTDLFATLTSGSSPVVGEYVQFSLNGNAIGVPVVTDANGVASLSHVSLSGIGANTYIGYITAEFLGDSTYAGSHGLNDLTVTPATLTIVAAQLTKVYGQTDPALAYSVSGLVTGDVAASVLTGWLSRIAGENVGSYEISQFSLHSTSDNYIISFTGSALAITPAALTVTAHNASRLYGAANPSFSVSYSGFVPGEDTGALGGALAIATPATPASSVGDYAIAPSGLTSNNYTISFNSGTLTVTKAPLVVTAHDVTKIYGQTPVLTGTISGIMNGDDITPVFTSTGSATNADVGSYAIVDPPSDPGNKLGNYELTEHAGTLTVVPAPLSVAANNAFKTYGQANPTLGGSLVGVVAGDDITADFSTAAADHSHVGSYAVTASLVDPNNRLANYTITNTPGILSVTPATLTVAAVAGNKIYDGTTFAAVTLSDNRISGDTLTITDSSAVFDTRNAGTGKMVTVSGISISGADAGNYTANTIATATADITRLAITGSFTVANKIYDGTRTAAVAGSSLTGQISGDSVGLVVGSATFADKNVGAGKTVTAALGLTGDDAGNYSINGSATTTANITARALAVTAAGVNKIYDGTTSATASLSDNRIPGDVLTGVYTSAVFSDKNVGTAKSVSVSGITVSGPDAGNYVVNSTAAASANITPRALLVSATGVNKVYDGTVAATVTISDNRIAGDVLTGTYTSAVFSDKNVATGKAVAVAGISITGQDSANYAANTTANTTANITSAPLTITANNQTIAYHAAIPVLTASYAGFVNGETSASLVTLPSLSTMATATSPAGTYAITASGAYSPNYSISYVPGSLTITAPANTASGHVFVDVTGNGLSADDTPMSGVSVKLFLDNNHNGTLDSGDGTAVQAVTTDASGAYSFSSLTSGNTYFVQEVLPSGYIRTAPALSDNYAVPVTGLANTTGLDFDNFNKTCCTNSVANVSFLINGTTTVTDLRGTTHQGDTVKARFTVTGSTPVRLSFVTYNAPDPVFNADDASEQTFYQLATGLFSPGANSMTVTIPANYYQIDFVCGYAIDQLGPAGSNIFYSAQGRLISADNGGLHSDTDNEAAATSFWANLGQTLIKSFGGSESSTALGNWLAQTYPKMYGASCQNSANNLTNDSNTTVAALFKSFYKNNTHGGADAQVMATALNVYASTLSLGGTTAECPQYGFDATAQGLGAAEFNVGNNGAAFNVTNNSTLTVSQLLAAANAKSSSDVLYNNVTSLLQMAYNMFSQVNGSGGIV